MPKEFSLGLGHFTDNNNTDTVSRTRHFTDMDFSPTWTFHRQDISPTWIFHRQDISPTWIFHVKNMICNQYSILERRNVL